MPGHEEAAASIDDARGTHARVRVVTNHDLRMNELDALHSREVRRRLLVSCEPQRRVTTAERAAAQSAERTRTDVRAGIQEAHGVRVGRRREDRAGAARRSAERQRRQHDRLRHLQPAGAIASLSSQPVTWTLSRETYLRRGEDGVEHVLLHSHAGRRAHLKRAFLSISRPVVARKRGVTKRAKRGPAVVSPRASTLAVRRASLAARSLAQRA